MGLFDGMYEKRKAKIADSAAPFLGAGEVPGATAICQSETQAAQAVMGKQPYSQFLATATDETFYVFGISPFKNHVYGESMDARPITALEAHMDDGSAVIGEFRLAPLRAKRELEELVAFVEAHNGA